MRGCGERKREGDRGERERGRGGEGEKGRGGEAVVTRRARPLLLCLGLLT